jgi:hydrocephalus-inducing protein
MCRKKIEFSLVENPQKDAVDLLGSINYPNASISLREIDFGSVLNDTNHAVEVVVTNTSEVPVKYHWDMKETRHPGGLAEDSMANTQLFDIKPIEGFLQPGEIETARVTYFALAGKPAVATGVMRVQGGPSIVLPIKGTPNSMSFVLEPQDVHFGVCQYDAFAQKSVTLSNPSKYALPLSPRVFPCVSTRFGALFNRDVDLEDSPICQELGSLQSRGVLCTNGM